jgi:hypothetical protein
MLAVEHDGFSATPAGGRLTGRRQECVERGYFRSCGSVQYDPLPPLTWRTPGDSADIADEASYDEVD